MPALSPVQTITAAGQQLVFNCPASQMVSPAALVVFNKSSYELETASGQLIPAWGIIPISLAAGLGSSPNMVFTSILADGAVVAPVSTVYVQWFSGAESIPDESAFTADAIAAAITGTVGITGTVDVTGSTVDIASGSTIGITGPVDASGSTIDIGSGNEIIIGNKYGAGSGPGFVCNATNQAISIVTTSTAFTFMFGGTSGSQALVGAFSALVNGTAYDFNLEDSSGIFFSGSVAAAGPSYGINLNHIINTQVNVNCSISGATRFSICYNFLL